MNFDREKKINRLLLNSAKAYQKFKDGFLKVPIELAVFALREANTSQVRSYLASQFIYSGKAPVSDKPQDKIANQLDISSRTVRRHFEWLLSRNWMGKDSKNGWYFFRGLDFVHDLEGWKYSRSAVMVKKDLTHTKEYLVGAVIASIIKTGQATGTERVSRRSEQSGWPVSLSLIQEVLGCSRKTAFTYRKIAKKQEYIYMVLNLQQVKLSPTDIRFLKQNEDKVTVPLFGSTQTLEVKPEQLRTDKGLVYAQLTNLITPTIQLRKR